MIKLHLGCGERDFGSEWTHIDGGDFSHLHSHDITKLPFEDESVNVIYASHVIEYFDRDEIIPILLEWKRTLVKGGILRIAVPDFEQMAWSYCMDDYSLKNFLGPIYGKMQMGDKTIYHKTCYDLYDLSIVLDNCGFQNVHKYNWRTTEHSDIDDHSQAYIPKMNKNTGKLISLNVECYV